MSATGAQGSVFAPTLVTEDGRWLVLVPGFGSSVQTYECETEAQARALLAVFTSAQPARRRRSP